MLDVRFHLSPMGFGRVQDLTDDELVRRFREAGDQAAFAELFRRYRPKIWRACIVFLRDIDEAEDLTQDAYLRAMGRIDQFRSGSFAAWLLSIAKSLCINYMKSKSARREVQDTGQSECRPSAEDQAFAGDILSLLDGLPAQQRICLKLFYLEGYSSKEVSARTGYLDDQVKSYIQNGKRRLRLAWEARAVARREV